MSSARRERTTTSYAILGLLAVRPWSTYELAQQMRRNLHYFWPRAESNLYAEPKRLVEAGLATARSEPVGQRPRTVYSITPKGRRALGRWLAKPASDSRLESETLVKLAFAGSGSKRDLLLSLERYREVAEIRREELRAIFHEYLRGEDPFPARVHLNVVAYRLLWDTAETEVGWAAWAIDQVQRWSDDLRTPSDRQAHLDVLDEALARGGESRASDPTVHVFG